MITEICVNPMISVVMPVYNNAAFLPEAIESILKQTFDHFEFIIVDDGSTDGSRSIISDYTHKDRRIHSLFMNHRGVVAAMSEGINQARGQWIARMDSDDIALPDKFAIQLAWAEKNGLDVCGTQAKKFGKTNGKLCFPVKHEAICNELFFRCPILYPTVMIRRSVLLDNPSPDDCVFDDYELFTRLAPRYRLGNVPLVLLSYRHHESQSTKIMKREFKKDFRKYRFRYFYKMFPNTPLSDYLPLALISDRLPLPNLHDLARAGQWLVELADIPDENIRRWMGKRWQKACRRSAKLGEECDMIFQRYRFISGNGSDIDDVEII